ncbi:hypothetical protein AB0M28_13435 [Streptomyces sp. NPDC051940]|uniref:hypothetical protein n=1 Tax=Streptomyces sp. NPDC051940 TaxID=3155675 RepID=UPI00343BE75C
MSTDISFLFGHTVTVEPYEGQSGTGPVYGGPVAVRCFLDEKTREVRDRHGEVVVSSSTAYCRLDTVAPAESRVTLPDGRATRVIAALRRDGGGLPTPDHLELQLV